MYDLNPPKQFYMDLKWRKSTNMIFAFLLILPLTCAVRITVKDCPVTETAWMARSQTFTCESTQVYHCIQDDEGKLMETCMVAYKIKPFEEGGCPWASYSTDRGSILGGIFHSCDGNGCPQKNDSDYWSNELYKYSICLPHYDKKTEVTKSTLSTSGSSEKTSAINNINGIGDGVIIDITTTAAATIVVFLVIVLIRRHKRLNSRKKFFSHPVECDRENLVLEEGSTEVEVYKENTYEWKSSSKEKIISKGVKWNARKKSEFRKVMDKDGQTRLRHACLAGNTDLVKSLLDIYTDVPLYIKDNNGYTPFLLAGFSGSIDLVQILIDKGCNVRSKDNTGKTIVHHACQAGHINLVKYLINLDEDVLCIKDNDGMTPLHCTNKTGQTIVHHACQAGYIKLVKYMIDLDEDVSYINDNNGMTPLHYIDKAGQTILHHACKWGELNLVKLFIGIEKSLLDVKNIHGLTPFHLAGFSGSVELVQCLIENGCNVHSKDYTGQTIVHIACEKGHLQLVEYLLSIDQDMLHMEDRNGMTPYRCKDKDGWAILHMACNAGHIELVKLVIEIDKDMLNERDQLGMTPFHLAGYSGSVELVQLLLDNGCDIYNKNKNGQTIMHVAFGMGNISLAKFLISIDTGILMINDYNGMTPFHCAGYSGSLELVQYLIDKGIDVFSKDNSGQTIVHFACQEGHVNLMKHLIEKDKNVLYTKDNYGLPPFHYARLSGSTELVQYLTDNGYNM